MIFEVGGGAIFRGLVANSKKKTLPAAHSPYKQEGSLGEGRL